MGCLTTIEAVGLSSRHTGKEWQIRFGKVSQLFDSGQLLELDMERTATPISLPDRQR